MKSITSGQYRRLLTMLKGPAPDTAGCLDGLQQVTQQPAGTAYMLTQHTYGAGPALQALPTNSSREHQF